MLQGRGGKDAWTHRAVNCASTMLVCEICHVPFKEKEYFDIYIKFSRHKIIWRGSPRKTLQVLAVHMRIVTVGVT